MNSPKIRSLLLYTFLFVASLVVARAGLSLTKGHSSPDPRHLDEDVIVHIDRDAIRAEARAFRMQADHMKADAEIAREHAERARQQAHKLAERIKAEVHVHIDEHDRDREVVLRESFEVSDGDRLVVKVPGADVVIVGGDTDDAEITIELEAHDMDKARAYFEALDFDVFQRDSEVHVKAESPSQKRWHWKRRGGAGIRVTASVPEQFDVNVTTSGGDISVNVLDGTVALTTSGGDIDLGDISGPEIRVTTSGGDIEASHLEGPTKLTTSGGDLCLGSVHGSQIYIRTSGGDICAETLDGDEIDARTSGGDIELGTVEGSGVLRTSGGDIKVDRVEGNLDAATSGGDIEANFESAGEVVLRTNGGSIELSVPSSTRADLDLKGDRVNLSDAFSFSGTLKKRIVKGEINGGGPSISASTNGGSVSMESR